MDKKKKLTSFESGHGAPMADYNSSTSESMIEIIPELKEREAEGRRTRCVHSRRSSAPSFSILQNDNNAETRRCGYGWGTIKNSYFMIKLLTISILNAAVGVAGLLCFYLDVFKLQSNLNDLVSLDSCYQVTYYGLLVYHTVPIAICLGLPGTGLLIFDLFSRDHARKVKRTLFLQFCEIVAALLLAFLFGAFVYLVSQFFREKAFSCEKYEMVIFSFCGFCLSISIYIEITYFTRFREHIKMQLGAFKESDQTGNIRNRIGHKKGAFESEKHHYYILLRKKAFKAAQSGNLEEMQEILVDAQTKLGNDFAQKMYNKPPVFWLGLFATSKKNPMHIAAHSGDIEMMEMLEEAGFDINAYDKVDRARFSTSDIFWYIARFFIKRTVSTDDINTSTFFKTTLVTPLHCATGASRIKAVDWLIKEKAHINALSKSSCRSDRLSPIFLAEHPAIAESLLASGANHLMVPDPGGVNTITALELAYLKENYAVGSVLEEWGGDLALTPLHTAAASNDHSAVVQVLRHQSNPNCLGEYGYDGINRRAPLHWAAVMGCVESAKVLLHYKADANIRDRRGRTPLHWAARMNRLEMVKLLTIEWHVEVNLLDMDDMTPLMCAACADNVSNNLFKSLMHKGADVNYQLPKSGDTALHIAIENNSKETALALLEAGSDIMMTNSKGQRPLDMTHNTDLQYAIKKAAGTRDVMISYTHSHSQFAQKIRKSLEQAKITTWLDLMDPSGIGGGSVWREEIARGISNAAVVLCLLTEDYVKSEWCLKELAYAKQVGTPIMAISSEGVQVNEDLQVYLYTRQMIPFEKAITAVDQENKRNVLYTYDEKVYAEQFMQVLDGVRDEVEQHRFRHMQRHLQTIGTSQDSDALYRQDVILQYDQLGEHENTFIFLSHGDCNNAFAREVCTEFSRRKLKVYVDCLNDPSIEMQERIRRAKEAILKCSCFVVILSSSSYSHELINDQLAFAEDKGKPILPILLSKPNLALGQRYTLSRNEVFNFSQGIGFSSSFDILYSGLQKHVSVQDESSFIRRRTATSNAGRLTGGTKISNYSDFLSSNIEKFEF